LHTANNAPNIPEGILTAISEKVQTPASAVVVTVPANIARDRPQRGYATRNDNIVIVVKTMETTMIVPQKQQQRQQRQARCNSKRGCSCCHHRDGGCDNQILPGINRNGDAPHAMTMLLSLHNNCPSTTTTTRTTTSAE
jgi:hypothetical protein